MENKKYVEIIFRLYGKLYGFSNRPSGPGYMLNDIYYGRPIIYLGYFCIQIPFVLIINGKIKIMKPGRKYLIRKLNKKL